MGQHVAGCPQRDVGRIDVGRIDVGRINNTTALQLQQHKTRFVVGLALLRTYVHQLAVSQCMHCLSTRQLTCFKTVI